MKKSIFLSIFLLSIASHMASGQPNAGKVFSLQHQRVDLPLFGNDITINDQPLQNQQTLSMCSAFNGWLFAAYSYRKTVGEFLVLLQSTDAGITWSTLMESQQIASHSIIVKTSLTTTGNSISNLKLFLGLVQYDTMDAREKHSFIGRYNVVPFAGEQALTEGFGHVVDLELCNDFTLPAAGSNPNSFCVVYSRCEYNYNDSIICRTSDNGLTFTSKQFIASTSDHFGKVSLAYGSLSANNSGRYYAVWEQKVNESDTLGHIYYAHSQNTFNGPFTTPVCLDCLDPAATNLCRNPAVACQYGVSANDSSNVTAVVLFEKFSPPLQKYDIAGFYNLQSATTGFFKPLSFTNPVHANRQPGIAFNPADSTFNLTWFDFTEQKLPLVTNGKNLANPNAWQMVSTGYNDQGNLTSPEPVMCINMGLHTGCNLWISDRPDGNGKILFDAQYNTYPGIADGESVPPDRHINVFPNPCSNSTTIRFEVPCSAKATIVLVDALGRPVKIIADRTFTSGRHQVVADCSDIQAGIYLCLLRTTGFNGSCKLMITK